MKRISFTLIIVLGAINLQSGYAIEDKEISRVEKEIFLVAEKQALEIESELGIIMSSTRTLATVFSTFPNDKSSILDRKSANNILASILKNRKELLGIYTLWEPNAFDKRDIEFIGKEGHDSTGRFIPYWSKYDNELILEPILDYTQESIGDFYLVPKKTMKDTIITYPYSIKEENVLMASLITPVLIDDKFKAIVGIDFSLNIIQECVLNTKKSIFNGEANITIITDEGICIANTNHPELIGTNIIDYSKNAAEQINKIKTGKKYEQNANGKIEVFVPIKMREYSSPWQVCISISENVALKYCSLK